MRRLFLTLAVPLLLGSSRLFSQAVLSERLQTELDKAKENNAPIQAIVMLDQQVDIPALDRQLYSGKASMNDRAYKVITSLQSMAASTQGDLLDYLSSKSSTEVISYREFWIANMIQVEAVPSVLMDLARNTKVGFMDVDAKLDWDRPVARRSGKEASPNGSEPGLKAINAHLMWALGFTGAGRIVMNDDTGVDWTHPAITARWRGNFVPHDQAWFENGAPSMGTPNDCDGHGTHTMGTMCGLNTANNDTIGVAFGAQWIASNGICTSPHTTWSIAGWQWAMDPDGNPNTITDMPDAINNSWYDPSATDCGSGIYRPVMDAVEAAGIAIVFSAGNNGPGPSTLTIPKNTNTTLVNAFATGAVDANGSWPYPVASFSSRGPSTCGGTGSLLIKPEASAPGVNVRSSTPGNTYSNFDGTSMAAPHVCGAIALLKQAFPNKTGLEIKMALYQTARDLGTAGEDNDYGMGFIDVYAAYQSLGDPEDPRDPTAVEAYSDYLTPTSALLTWTDPDHFVSGDTLINFSIVIHRNDSLLTIVAKGVETYTDNGLTDGTEYDYTVYARATPSDSLSLGVAVSVWAGGSPVPGAPTNLVGVGDTVDAVLTWTDPTVQSDGTPLDDLAKIYVYRSGVLIDSVAPGVATYTDNPPQGFVQSYTLRAVDNEAVVHYSTESNGVQVYVGYTPAYMVWVGPDATGANASSGDSLLSALIANGESAYLSNDLFEFGSDLSIYDGIFVVLGIYSTNHVIGSGDPEGPALQTYLQSGGRVYLEGGDCFNYDPETGGYNIRPWFALNDGADGGADLAGITGKNDLSAFSFAYTGTNSFMDELHPAGSTVIWKNSANADTSGVFYVGYSGGSGRSIGVVPSFGGLVNSSASVVAHSNGQTEGTKVPRSMMPKEARAPFMKKAGYYPELKSTRKSFQEVLAYGPGGGPRILGNNKRDLMTAYLGLFWNTGDPTISVSDTAITDTLLVGGTGERTFTVSNSGGSLADDLTFAIAENPSSAWVEVTPVSDTLSGNQQSVITVSLDATGLSSGLYTTTLEITSNDAVYPLKTVAVSLQVNAAPEISVEPDTVFFSVSSTQAADSSTFWIYNTGVGPLEVSAIEAEEMLSVRSVIEPKETPEYPKGSVEPTYGFQTEGRGGPDGFGYRWVDSDEPGGPAFNWSDISGVGTLVSGWLGSGGTANDDDGAVLVSLPFGFSYYGATYTQIRIVTNGWIGLDAASTNTAFSNAAIPAVALPNLALYPFWDDMDLDPALGGAVYYYHDAANHRFIVQYTNVPHYAGTVGLYTYQAVLYENSKIVYQYLDMQQTVNSATIGMENAGGTDGLQVVYNQAYMHNNLAIVISTGVLWMSLDPTSGSVAPEDSMEVQVNVDGTGLAEGWYTAKLTVTSNDPVNGTYEHPYVRMYVDDLVAVEGSIEALLPQAYALHSNYPNPFNPATTIRYDLKDAGRVSLKVFNVLGQEVRTLVNTSQTAGFQQVNWDGKNNTGQTVSSGIYIYRLETEKFTQSRKMMFLK